MSLERKDIRAKLDPEVHAALQVLCDVDGVDICSFVELVIAEVVRKRVHEATLVADKLQRLGISALAWEPPGAGKA